VKKANCGAYTEFPTTRVRLGVGGLNIPKNGKREAKHSPGKRKKKSEALWENSTESLRGFRPDRF